MDGSENSDNFVHPIKPGAFMLEDGLGEESLQTEGGASAADLQDDDALREQDRFLPIANVARIMKNAVPKNGKIAKDAKECVQECVSEFISFITSEASERCHQEKRKTINGEDILFAMSTLGFDNHVEPLKQYLQKYRESIKGDKTMGEHTEVIDADMSEDQLASLTNNLLEQANSQGGVVYAYQSTTMPTINLS